MATPTDAEMVDALRDAIFKITLRKVQSVNIGGQNFNHLQLKDLEDLLRCYEFKVAEASGHTTALISLPGAGL